MSEIELINFADLQTCMMLKQIGYDEKCFMVYYDSELEHYESNGNNSQLKTDGLINVNSFCTVSRRDAKSAEGFVLFFLCGLCVFARQYKCWFFL